MPPRARLTPLTHVQGRTGRGRPWAHMSPSAPLAPPLPAPSHSPLPSSCPPPAPSRAPAPSPTPPPTPPPSSWPCAQEVRFTYVLLPMRLLVLMLLLSLHFHLLGSAPRRRNAPGKVCDEPIRLLGHSALSCAASLYKIILDGQFWGPPRHLKTPISQFGHRSLSCGWSLRLVTRTHTHGLAPDPPISMLIRLDLAGGLLTAINKHPFLSTVLANSFINIEIGGRG